MTSDLGSGCTFEFLLGCHEALLGLLPIDDFPEVFEVLGSGIPVVDVVSMLPNITVNDRDKCGTLFLDEGLV